MFGAESEGTLFLGEDLLVYLVLAFGAALFVGNVAALVRPPTRAGDAADGEVAQSARRPQPGDGRPGPGGHRVGPGLVAGRLTLVSRPGR